VDKFLELPLPQRILAVGVVLALLGGATYYLLISPVSDGISSQAKKYKALMTEYAQLKEYDSPEFKRRLEQERTDAIRKRVEYAKMLPREEELPDLITSIKADADSAGLIVSRFEPTHKKTGGDGYRGIPFNLSLLGTTSQFVTFLQALAQPSKRLINAKNLSIDTTTASGVQAAAGDVGLMRILMEREKSRGLNANEQYAKAVMEFEAEAKRSILKVDMTALAYVYTGGAAAGGAAGARGATGGPK
jgi:Tfp pilus assembly protein PilO